MRHKYLKHGMFIYETPEGVQHIRDYPPFGMLITGYASIPDGGDIKAIHQLKPTFELTSALDQIAALGLDRKPYVQIHDEIIVDTTMMATHPLTATGKDVDRLADQYGVTPRCQDESDESLRGRILATVRYRGNTGIPYFEVTLKINKCECGSEKTKTPGHSTWCPKYEKL